MNRKGAQPRTIQYSNDGGKTWSTCVAKPGSLMYCVGSQPTTDDMGNWYRALGSTIPVGGRS